MSAADGHVPAPHVLAEDIVPSKRHARTRARTESIKRLSKRTLERDGLVYPPSINEAHQRPRTREDCLPGGCNEQRPCPFVGCKHNLYLDVNERTGSVKYNFPDREPWDMPESCALDISDRGGETLENVGEYVNCTRERIRQLETKGLYKIRASSLTNVLAELSEDE